MFDTIRLYIDAVVALITMAILGGIAGLIAAAVTGDRTHAAIASTAVFVLTGAVLMIRLWRVTHKPIAPLDPGV